MNLKKTYFLLFSFFLFSFGVDPQNLPKQIKVGLYYGHNIRSATTQAIGGKYELYSKGEFIKEIAKGGQLTFTASDSGIQLKHNDKKAGFFKKPLKMKKKSDNSDFTLNPIKDYHQKRYYNGGMIIDNSNGNLKLINKLPVEEYIAGVVLAEAGSDKELEFYKAQAVICRTYALHNLKRFKSKGFHLCDNVECQVYEGINRHEAKIDKAVKATEGIVLVDNNLNLITAAYHSNSGGKTVNAEDAWSFSVPYLRSIKDPFSRNQPHSTWKKEISMNKWFVYLKSEHNYPVNDTFYRQYAKDYCPKKRARYFLPHKRKIELKKIRKDLSLGSTYFTIQTKGNKAIFKGKGFGHGVGLSQEGAMRMAEHGIPYTDILHFYYKDVNLVKTSAIEFFRKH
ncbi:MAG: SpoIID/LytB domain-containing protein [Flavobacteriales bacterium]